MQKNDADATDIKFIILWLADRNIQYASHSEDGLISLVQKFRNKLASDETLAAALKVLARIGIFCSLAFHQL